MANTKAEQSEGFTAEERDAMKERAKEVRTARRRSGGKAKADGDADIRAKIAEMEDADRVLAERVHELVRAAAPGLEPKLWYGMPAYAKDGKVLCFFQSAAKFKARYATLGFNDVATLDDGAMWPTAFALTNLTTDVEAHITDLVTKAAT
ncbi:iron chaperone [Actinomadura flavalba]|uniref:iron chaperone n=1 Tax=Actinomadura flavalba TaxID=1120938 RepID=UPI00037DBE8F|nr:DUF1801 domain-containing protein [Actinomadura flavalba]